MRDVPRGRRSGEHHHGTPAQCSQPSFRRSQEIERGGNGTGGHQRQGQHAIVHRSAVTGGNQSGCWLRAFSGKKQEIISLPGETARKNCFLDPLSITNSSRRTKIAPWRRSHPRSANPKAAGVGTASSHPRTMAEVEAAAATISTTTA